MFDTYQDRVKAYRKKTEFTHDGRRLIVRSFYADFMVCRDLDEPDELKRLVCLKGRGELRAV